MPVQTKKTTTSLIKLVKLLNDGHYHDGTSIGNKLKITRSAVWKAVQKLQNYGVTIDSVKGKGYALLEPLTLLDKKIILSSLENNEIDLQIFESITSTNDYVKENPKKNKISFCLAEQQTQGKGRLHRAWHSPFAQNIYLTCAYPFQKDVSELSGLSLIVSLSIVKTLQNFKLQHPITTKWPNDVLYQQQKIAGTLIEIQAESHGRSDATIGIGINVNMLNDEKDINQRWTSLRKILGEYVDRNFLTSLLIDNLLSYLELFKRHGFEFFIEEWNSVDSLLKKTISLSNLSNKISGVVQGVDQQGHLLLKLPDNVIKSFSSGDTSISQAK